MLTYTRQRRSHWDKVFARNRTHRLASHYHQLLQRCYQFHIPAGMRVLELGCGNGQLLAAVNPSLGVGVDFSRQALSVASDTHPGLYLVQADAHFLPFRTTFDVIILSDLINDLWDVQKVFDSLLAYSHNRTRIIINVHSRLWQLPLIWVEKLKFKNRTLEQNWFTIEDIRNLYNLTDYELIKHEREILFPLGIPVLSWLFNNVLVRFWPFWILAMTNLLVARPLKAKHNLRSKHPSVSIVIPARNEAGNIQHIFERLPKMGSETELIFVEGHSKDNTKETIQGEIEKRPDQKATLLSQHGVGKADAVRTGFTAAKNELLMILDADLSVQPEDLSRFFEAAQLNKGEFINGTRLVYPMENRAMQLANILGNKSFSRIFTWLLGQPIKDTLCGTKVIWRSDYQLLRQQWPATFDPFGDFDLLLGATKLDLRIIDIPIRYHERKYGSTNISRWRHGLMLLRITLAATLRLKFRLGKQ
ncbi:MAG: glycosyltransferase [Anaerolineales bacterium]